MAQTVTHDGFFEVVWNAETWSGQCCCRSHGPPLLWKRMLAILLAPTISSPQRLTRLGNASVAALAPRFSRVSLGTHLTGTHTQPDTPNSCSDGQAVLYPPYRPERSPGGFYSHTLAPARLSQQRLRKLPDGGPLLSPRLSAVSLRGDSSQPPGSKTDC